VRSLLSVLVLAAAGLTAGGCATAGLALMGPLASSVTAVVDRSVDRTLPADLGTTWGATTDALARMAVRLDQTEKEGAKWRLAGTGEAVTVHGTLERVTMGMTKVSVRVEAGGLFADKQTSEELLNQIAASLARFTGASSRETASPGPDAASQDLRRLHREIERLGTRIEQAREAPRVPPRPETHPVATVTSTPIIVVPTSAGVATVPAADVSLQRPTPPSASGPPAGRRDVRPPATLPPAEPQGVRADDIVAGSMKSVEVLRPVEALQIRPARE
jgi:hypothetical protein